MSGFVLVQPGDPEYEESKRMLLPVGKNDQLEFSLKYKSHEFEHNQQELKDKLDQLLSNVVEMQRLLTERKQSGQDLYLIESLHELQAIEKKLKDADEHLKQLAVRLEKLEKSGIIQQKHKKIWEEHNELKNILEECRGRTLGVYSGRLIKYKSDSGKPGGKAPRKGTVKEPLWNYLEKVPESALKHPKELAEEMLAKCDTGDIRYLSGKRERIRGVKVTTIESEIKKFKQAQKKLRSHESLNAV